MTDPGAFRADNGLRAATYVPLTDVEPALGQHLLTALGRARIAAYLAEPPSAAEPRRRLFVAADERTDARTIVAAAVRALGEDDPTVGDVATAEPPAGTPAPDGAPSAVDPLAGIDTDRAFAELIADWHVDTHHAIREAEKDLSREDSDWRARLQRSAAEAADEGPVWLDDDHYVPPPPPPLPRLAAPTVLALVVLVLSVLVLALGSRLALPGNLSLVLGIGGVLVAGGLFLSRLHDTGRDDDDDGAAI